MRESLEAIRAELSFQTFGDVSDDPVQRLGAMLGAETLISEINPFIGIGSFIQGDFEGGRKVVFWEIVGGLGLWYGNYRVEENKSNGEVYMTLGGIALGGAVIYFWIRPWMYNREPKVTGVLDNVQIFHRLRERTVSGIYHPVLTFIS